MNLTRILIMKPFPLILTAAVLFSVHCTQPKSELKSYVSVYKVDSGKAVAVQLTAYSTTLIANGHDSTRLRVALIDSLGREIGSANDTVRIVIKGDGSFVSLAGKKLSVKTDTAGSYYAECALQNGAFEMMFVAGLQPGKVKVEARSGKLWPGSHEIHMLPADFKNLVPSGEQLAYQGLKADKIIGADISWLPELEASGKMFYENNQPVDAIELLKKHGFNYIRLRIFVDPSAKNGYSPGKNWCGTEQTLLMAKRISDAGMKILLDFHYSDYWADPQQQYKPSRWSNLNFENLKDSVKNYTTNILMALRQQGTLPAMVQIGNEINHGMLWPDGHISHPDQLADLLNAGVEGTRTALPEVPVMLHLALGGQNSEAGFWLDNMIARGVKFDVIGLSYYPRWHGTLDDLQHNLDDLAHRYHKPLNVVEYSDYKHEVLEMAFNLADNLGTGACIWEPLNWRSRLFDDKGNATHVFAIYDEISKKYLVKGSKTTH